MDLSKDLYMEGLLLQAWALGARDRGAVLFEAESPEHLQEIIGSFAPIEANCSNTQVFPLTPDPAFAENSRSLIKTVFLQLENPINVI